MDGLLVSGRRTAWRARSPGLARLLDVRRPLLLLVPAAAPPWLKEPPARQPVWAIAGHVAAMMLIHPAGTDLGLLPLAMVFIGLPAYGALYLAGMLGRALFAPRSRDA